MPNQEKATGAVGVPTRRTDGREKVTGAARYAAEAPIPKAAFGYILPSTIAKGVIKSIDTSAAEKAIGVIAILTPVNMPKLHGGHSGDTRAPFSDMNILYAGQHVAVVVADTPERARHASSLIKVEYSELKPVVDVHDSAAALNESPTFFGSPLGFSKGDAKSALSAQGATVVKQTYTTPIETHNPMEMSATVALWEGDDKLVVWDSTQGVSNTHSSLAKAFGLKPENVRVYCPYTGGGFGCKGEEWPHKFLTVAAAKLAKRPVRLALTRAQMFTSSGHRPFCEQEISLSAGADGKITGLRHFVLTQVSPSSSFIETCASGTSRVLYSTASIEVVQHVKTMDLPPGTWMRAPGETPGMFALESAMDELAHELKMDPVALRLANHADVSPESNLPWSSKHLKECYARGAEKFGWSKRNPIPASTKTVDGKWVGYGMASATYPAMIFPGQARVRLYKEGNGVRAVSAAASQDLGTGTWTIGAQMTATLLDLPAGQVKFELGDSNLPTSGQSGGSATAGSLALALGDASESLKAELLKHADGTPLAGIDIKDVHFQEGYLASKSTPSAKVTLRDLVQKAGTEYVEGTTSDHHKYQPTGEDYMANDGKFAFQSFGAHFVEVQIDDLLPMVKVTRVVSVMDIGRVLNPRTARSQVQGGVVMGLGQALTEDTHYDLRTGRPINDNFADYLAPVNPDIHSLEVEFIDVPDLHFNPIGCRGVGEIGITGVAAAVANAVFNATGKRIRDLPITPDKLL